MRWRRRELINNQCCDGLWRVQATTGKLELLQQRECERGEKRARSTGNCKRDQNAEHEERERKMMKIGSSPATIANNRGLREEPRLRNEKLIQFATDKCN